MKNNKRRKTYDVAALKKMNPQALIRRAKVLRFVYGFMGINGVAPSIREIMAGTGLQSTSTVNYHLKKLARDGFIRFYGEKGSEARSIIIPHSELVLPDLPEWVEAVLSEAESADEKISV